MIRILSSEVIFDFAEGAWGPSASTKILLPLVFDLGQYIDINNSIKVSRATSVQLQEPKGFNVHFRARHSLNLEHCLLVVGSELR